MENLNEVLKDVMTITSLAGKKVISYYGQELAISDKGNDSPVTIADLESNEILIKGLSKYDWPILSEEGVLDGERFDSKLVWIIDPLDGTKDFIQETGEFTIMVALVEKQQSGNFRPLLGIIYRPVTDTFYYATKGGGAWMKRGDGENEKMLVSTEREWQKITMLTSRNHTTELESNVVKKLGILKVETYGSSLKACLVGTGVAQLTFNPSPFTWEWDVCPSDLIVHEAGGSFSDKEGKLFNYNKKDPRNHLGYVVSNGFIHKTIIKNIKELSRE